jgi:MFS family permease
VSGYRIAGDIGAIVGPILAGVLAQYVSFRAAFLVCGALAAVVCVTALAAEETLPATAREAAAPA